MTKNISSRDWEALSAYIDGYLSQRERQQLEERLQRSMELKHGLDELRRTRQVLRSHPKMRAPRNFTLTPEMVSVQETRRSGSGMFPVMRLASVLASILLVLVVVGDLLTVPLMRTTQSVMTDSAIEAPAPELPAMEEAEMPAEMLAAVPVTEGPSEKALAPNATPEGEMMLMVAPTEEALEAQTEPPAALAMPSGGGGRGEDAQATAEAGLSVPAETPAPIQGFAPAPMDEPAALAPPQPAGRIYWRTAEILLALVAISSGLVALYLRRSATG